jgi:hypothetical protein
MAVPQDRVVKEDCFHILFIFWKTLSRPGKSISPFLAHHVTKFAQPSQAQRNHRLLLQRALIIAARAGTSGSFLIPTSLLWNAIQGLQRRF